MPNRIEFWYAVTGVPEFKLFKYAYTRIPARTCVQFTSEDVEVREIPHIPFEFPKTWLLLAARGPEKPY